MFQSPKSGKIELNNTNRNFRGGYLEAKDKFANMSNENYDDSAYDFSLLPSETCGNGS